MNAVYAVIANHKRVTKKGIIHATNLPEYVVDQMLQELLDNGKIKTRSTYQDKGETINIPVYYPKKMYK